MQVKPIWSDSMGAKSLCTLVRTPDISLLIDPGSAVMQPSFPGSESQKEAWLESSRHAISRAARKADHMAITHYHFDHFDPDDMALYSKKHLYLKDPNSYINLSQKKRCLSFLEKLCSYFGETSLSGLMEEPIEKNFPDPMENLPLAARKSFGSYDARRRELLGKGAGWFEKLSGSWNRSSRIPELEFKDLKVSFSDGKTFEFKKTRLRFPKPMFHGLEYSRLGWVTPVIVEFGADKFLYSSDLCGPIVEDYAEWIISEDPTVMVLDGPPTYLVPYLMNRINLERALGNLENIASKTTGLILLDHHIMRDKKYRDFLKKIPGRERIHSFAEYSGGRCVLDLMP